LIYGTKRRHRCDMASRAFRHGSSPYGLRRRVTSNHLYRGVAPASFSEPEIASTNERIENPLLARLLKSRRRPSIVRATEHSPAAAAPYRTRALGGIQFVPPCTALLPGKRRSLLCLQQQMPPLYKFNEAETDVTRQWSDYGKLTAIALVQLLVRLNESCPFELCFPDIRTPILMTFRNSLCESASSVTWQRK